MMKNSSCRGEGGFSHQKAQESGITPQKHFSQAGCGSGSAWIRIYFTCWIWIQKKKNFKKKARKLLIHAILFNFKVNLHKAPFFYDCRKLFMSLFFSKFVKLDPDSHGSAFSLPPGSRSAFRKTGGSGSRSAKNECGSTALRLCRFWCPLGSMWRRPR